MMFGEAESESPRVPSPWTKARSSGSRSSNNSTPQSIHKNARASSSIGKAEAEEEALSTPPTEEEEVEGFFSLDLLELGSNDSSKETAVEASQPTKPCLVNFSQSSNQRPSIPRPNRLAPEPDALGNLEYKLRLLPPTRLRYDRLLTQLKWRLVQGGGFCTYEIGVLDDGRCIGICPTEMRVSLRVLAKLASELGASVRVRRAFALIESGRQSSKTGKINQLRSLDNEEARNKLVKLSKGVTSDDVERVEGCACRAGEEILAWPDGKTLSKSFEMETADGEEQYQVAIEDVKDIITAGSWMGATDSDGDCDEGAEEDEYDGLEESNEEVGFTFSLSLDEMATRRGVGFHRRNTRRKCRYQAKVAQIRGKKDDSSMQQQVLFTSSSPSPSPLPSLTNAAKGSIALIPVPVNEAVLLRPDDEALAIEGNSSSQATCEKIIVEAFVTKLEDEDAQDFIDYSLL